MKRTLLAILLGSFPVLGFATGLNFWESSTVNSSLAAANGAKVGDASVLALAPSSITQLEAPTITASVTYYEVSTDYNIFGATTDYSQGDPIPAGFFALPINDNWAAGLAIYSRTAADISIPQITVVVPITAETRVRPITVSVAPTLAYKWNNLSFGVTVELLQSHYELYQTSCFITCNESRLKGSTSGWAGALSSTWIVNPEFSIAFTHRFATRYSDSNIEFDLPAITSLYATWEAIENLDWHFSYSHTGWEDKGVRYTDYSDPFGLLIGTTDSHRLATSVNYRLNDWELRAGISADEAIDAFGGIDVRYRLGLGYHFTENLQADFTGVFEDYAKKEFNTADGLNLISVQNRGFALSTGITYRF